jgi:TetR/AcrR family fatty acid metabolism transcriptional regulator
MSNAHNDGHGTFNESNSFLSGRILNETTAMAGARKITKEDAPARRARARVHNRDRQEDILVAARAVFEENGFDAASVAEIARRSRVAEGTIYLYSATKRELLQKVVARWYEGLIAEIERGLAERVGAEARLRYFAERHFRLHAEDAAIGRLMVRELRTAPDYPASGLHELNRRYTRLFTAIIRAGVASGEIHAGVRPDVARDMFFGALEHLGMGGMGRARRGDGALAFFVLFWRAIAGGKPTRDNG